MDDLNNNQNLQMQLEECQKKSEEYLSGWQRERADFANYKKDEAKLREDIKFYTKSKIIYEFLNIFDNFDLALKHMPPDLSENNWAKGIMHIRQQFEMILKGEGVEEIKSIGEKFDPTLHEALEETETEGKEGGIILEELQKGYKLVLDRDRGLDGRVIRPSKVKISK